MKRLTCEMCGSTDLIKQDGVFVCQSCGCKYSVEEAKKMMVEVEGKVDVSGSTVKVDNAARLENLYRVARRARDENNSGNAAKYYDMILIDDPNSWEASFYSVYYKAMSCTIAQIYSAAISVKNCEKSVLNLIRDNVQEYAQAAAVNEVAMRCAMIANMLFNAAESHYYEIRDNIRSDYTQEFIDNACAARDIMYSCGTQIDSLFKDNNIARIAAEAWKTGITLHEKILPFLSSSSSNRKTIVSYAQKIAKYEPGYANRYIVADRTKSLEQELATQKQRAASANESTFMEYGYVVLALIFGIGLLIAGFRGIDVFPLNLIVLLPGMGLIGLVIYRMITIKKLKEENRETVSDAERKIDKIEKELEALKKENQ